MNLGNTGGYLDTHVLRPERPESIYVLLHLPTLKPVSSQGVLEALEMPVAQT